MCSFITKKSPDFSELINNNVVTVSHKLSEKISRSKQTNV